MASFPEFEGPVALIIRRLFQDKVVIQFRNENRAFAVQCEVVLHSLLGVLVKDRYWLSYGPTLQAIVDGLGALDTYYRSVGVQHPFYHNLRYKLYENMLPSLIPEYVVMPVAKSIGATFLVKTRGVPLLFLGVVDRPNLADEYVNSPLDFWAHDVQHARRQYHETEKFYDAHWKHREYDTVRSPAVWMEKDKFYEMLSSYTLELWSKTQEHTEVGIRSLMKMILFEIFHEQAFVPTKEEICRAITTESITYPVEKFVIENQEMDPAEAQDDIDFPLERDRVVRQSNIGRGPVSTRSSIHPFGYEESFTPPSLERAAIIAQLAGLLEFRAAPDGQYFVSFGDQDMMQGFDTLVSYKSPLFYTKFDLLRAKEGPYFKKGSCLLIFKGTTTVRETRKINVKFSSTSGLVKDTIADDRIHKGFKRAFNDLFPHVDEALRNSCLDKDIIMGGHSLGGALSLITALAFKTELLNPENHGNLLSVVTFGCPRIADDNFYKFLMDFSVRNEIQIDQYRNGYFDKRGKFYPDPITRSVIMKLLVHTKYRPFVGNMECFNYLSGKPCSYLGRHAVSNYVNSLLVELWCNSPDKVRDFGIIGRDGLTHIWRQPRDCSKSYYKRFYEYESGEEVE